MPTTRPRLAITETDAIARALDVAELRWPGRSRAQLLVLLVEEGRRHVEHDEEHRLAALAATSGALTVAYGPGYLEDLREDWPA